MAPHFQLFISAEELFFKEKLSVLSYDKPTGRHRYPSELPPPRSSFGTENFSEDLKKRKKNLFYCLFPVLKAKLTCSLKLAE